MVQAIVLLEGMVEAGKQVLPDVVSYNTVIKACVGAGEILKALQVRPSITDGMEACSCFRAALCFCMK